MGDRTRQVDAATGPLDAFGPGSWRRPEATSFGRLPMRPFFDRTNVLSLDGQWSFRLRERPEDVTAEDLTGETAGWALVEVPGCWTMQGYDRPRYTNVQMPFRCSPLDVPRDNPTGVYRRRVTLPESWRGQRLVMRVGAAESVLYAYAGGTPVGMGKDSRLPHEFDIAGLVEPGSPFDLALVVVRWSDATYLEDQDHWHHAGVHRSVLVYATPRVHLSDVHAAADYDPATGTGGLDVKVGVDSTTDPPQGWTVRIDVAGRSQSAPVRFEHPDDTVVNMAVFEGRGARLALDLGHVLPWSAEEPHLYDLETTLLDAGGDLIDRVVLRIGFRRVEVKGCELLVNGRAVTIKGVNRHEHDARRGKSLAPEDVERDVVLMKRHNLNAIRTSHYPNGELLYDVCDRLGMYVLDEANVESHAYLRSLSRKHELAPAIVDRISRMALRDKNHPCVIMWSLGNESGVGPAHRAAAEWLRAFDPTRPVHYEGGISEDEMAIRARGEEPDLPAILARRRPETDVIAPMYPPVEVLVAWAEREKPSRPLVMCEYCHAMGNSCGGLDRYWEAIRAHRGLQGGFVWDWADQALVKLDAGGTERLCYGGDFGDEPNDGAFCLNGLVSADRAPHPSLLELAKVLQPVIVTLAATDPVRIQVSNESDFRDLSWLTGEWETTHDGMRLAAGRLPMPDLAAGAAREVAVPLTAGAIPASSEDGRVDLTVTFKTAHDLAWAERGHVVAYEQFELRAARRPASAPPRLAATRRSMTEGTQEADWQRLEPRLELWRAPIDNEELGPRHARRWERLGLRDAASLVALETDFEPDGEALVVRHRVVIPAELDDAPRVGVRLHFGPGARQVDWLGAGPHESYSDRRRAALLGRYSTSVDDWTVRYVRPQASGNRTGVRWLRLLGDGGEAMATIDEMDSLEVTVARFTEEQVAGARHWEELEPVDDCYVWVDVRQRGVGSGACGPDTAPEHRIGPGEYRWSYRLCIERPLGSSTRSSR